MTRRPSGAPRAVILAAGALSMAGLSFGCQSTQSKSAELAAQGETLLLDRERLDIGQQSTAVDVVEAKVLSDENGAAVVALLKNNSSQGLRDVPLLIEVKDAKGKTVFSNDDPGLEPTLTSIAYLRPGEESVWVHDQVFASGEPKDVEVTVGQTNEQLSGDPPEVTVAEPELEADPISGLQAVGEIHNESGEDLESVYYFAVARRDGEIVAAGRGASQKLKADYAHPRLFHIFFIGDPRGAEIDVTAVPTVFE